MRIALLTLGTRGDVQPYVALGKTLVERGHSVVVCAPDNFGAWVESHGLEFRAFGIDMEAVLRSEDTRAALAGNWFRMVKLARETMGPTIDRMLEVSAEVGGDADLIACHPKAFMGADVAEATGAAHASVSPIPLVATGEFAPIVWARNFGSAVNRWLYRLFTIGVWVYRGKMTPWRASLGLGPGRRFVRAGEVGGRQGLCLCGVSPSVIPRPADWHDQAHMTGYWFLDEDPDWRPDPELAHFLDAGEPPVYIGFGSMTTSSPERLAATIVDAVGRAGVRAVIATGWGAIDQVEVPPGADDRLHVLASAPHHALLPHMAAVVHHGGAGSTAAGLRAGKPTLVCPVGVDQPFWGRRVADLGCGPAPIRLKRLRADRLADALHTLVSDESLRHNAMELAAKIGFEDGCRVAADLLEAEVERHRAR